MNESNSGLPCYVYFDTGRALRIYKSKRKEEKDMAEVYATLIIKGVKTYAQVPDIMKPKVKAVLEALDMGELAVEE